MFSKKVFSSSIFSMELYCKLKKLKKKCFFSSLNVLKKILFLKNKPSKCWNYAFFWYTMDPYWYIFLARNTQMFLHSLRNRQLHILAICRMCTDVPWLLVKIVHPSFQSISPPKSQLLFNQLFDHEILLDLVCFNHVQQTAVHVLCHFVFSCNCLGWAVACRKTNYAPQLCEYL